MEVAIYDQLEVPGFHRHFSGGTRCPYIHRQMVFILTLLFRSPPTVRWSRASFGPRRPVTENMSSGAARGRGGAASGVTPGRRSGAGGAARPGAREWFGRVPAGGVTAIRHIRHSTLTAPPLSDRHHPALSNQRDYDK